MSFSSSLDFFNHLMNEGALDEAMLLAFLARSTSDEGLHLDFKTGQMFDPMPANEKKGRAPERDEDRRKRCAFVIRQYVAAFANSEGGVLAIGIKDQSREEKVRGEPKSLNAITPAHEASIGSDLKGWASRCVSELIGYLGVPPRFSTVDVADGKVLLIAVPRTASLVPVIKEGKQAYYFRVEDEAREVYPHLVSDLLLGRRSSPTLLVAANNWRADKASHVSVHQVSDEDEPEQRSQMLVVLTGSFTLTNDSLVTAEGMAAGVLGFSAKGRNREPDPPIPGDLRARVALLPPDDRTRHPYALMHTRLVFHAAQPGELPRRAVTLRPFDSEPASMNFLWRLEERGTRPGLCAVMALYLVPEGCEPLWFEVLVSAYDEPAARMNGRMIDVHIKRVVGRLPRIGVTLPREAAA